MADNATGEPSAASQLLEHHAAHRVTVEDAVDEELASPTTTTNGDGASEAPAPAAKAADKRKEPGLDTRSRELFPELGGAASRAPVVVPTWGAKATANGKANGASPTNGTPSTSAPASGVSTPVPQTPSLHIPGRNVEFMYLDSQHVLKRDQLKRPLPDIVREFNRKSRAKIDVHTLGNGKMKVEAAGPHEIATQALKDFVNQIGTKQTIKVSIPRSARAHIIGKGGSTIKQLQEKTGAKIQMPRVEESQSPIDEDDDATIDVIVEGNAVSAALAQQEIQRIAGDRAGNVNTRLRNIPLEFFPFIAGPKQSLVNDFENKGVQVRVPQNQVFSAQPPRLPATGQRPVFAPTPIEQAIQLAGERTAVQAARAEIERQARELQERLAMEQLSIQRGRHQFIIGDRGIPLDEFFEDTGCTIVMPTDEDDDMVTIIGYPDKVQAGLEKAMDLAMNMQCSNIDISRFHRQAPGGAAAHARNVTRYLRHRNEIRRLERLHNVHFNTPFSEEGALPWELYSRDGKNAIRAQSEIKGLVEAHPPSRLATLPVDPFFYNYLRNEVTPRVRRDYRVQLVVPDPSEDSAPLLLVYEGESSPDAYEVPRSQPNNSDVNEFQKWLQQAQTHIRDLISQQEELSSGSLDVPLKYHDKLRKFIKKEKEQDNNDPNKIPVRVSNAGTTVNIRGPKSSVETFVAKCKAFVEQEKQDEKERGFTLEFEFPQKFANHLIGKGGSNIKELREKFDVDIQVQDGKVELKGPKAKAEVAKTHILSLLRGYQDETTHVLKIEPKFHRELIGAQGAQINRLQTRYKVLIFFPRTARPAKDDESVTDSVSDAGKTRRQQAPDEVIIRGPKRGADEARDEILSLLQYLKDHSFTATVTVQQKQLPSLIGTGGAVLDQLRQATGARIDIPSAKDSPETQVEIQIRGTKAQVAAAQKELEQKKAVFDDTVLRTIDVDRKHHKALIGPHGSIVRDIVVKAGGSDDRRELARTIQFPKQDTDGSTIKVEGRTEVVEKILAQIKAIVSERESQVTEVLDVPTDKHRSLIGRGGDIKRGLESKFKVSIDIPRQGSDQTGVKIVGQPDNVQKAKAHIESLVQEQQGETVQVPRALHHTVSDSGKIFKRFKSDFGVTVDHAGQAIPPKPTAANPRANGGSAPLITDDEETTANAHSWKVVDAAGEEGEIPWVLRGAAEGVEKAKKALESALQQAKQQNAIGYLVLSDRKNHRFIIGQGGSKVNAIRKQSGCLIHVPRDGAEEDAIQVVGSLEGVEKAKDLILAAVKEGLAGRRGD